MAGCNRRRAAACPETLISSGLTAATARKLALTVALIAVEVVVRLATRALLGRGQSEEHTARWQFWVRQSLALLTAACSSSASSRSGSTHRSSSPARSASYSRPCSGGADPSRIDPASHTADRRAGCPGPGRVAPSLCAEGVDRARASRLLATDRQLARAHGTVHRGGDGRAWPERSNQPRHPGRVRRGGAWFRLDDLRDRRLPPVRFVKDGSSADHA